MKEFELLYSTRICEFIKDINCVVMNDFLGGGGWCGDGIWNYLKCFKYINCIFKVSIMYLYDFLGFFKFIWIINIFN